MKHVTMIANGALFIVFTGLFTTGAGMWTYGLYRCFTWGWEAFQ